MTLSQPCQHPFLADTQNHFKPSHLNGNSSKLSVKHYGKTGFYLTENRFFSTKFHKSKSALLIGKRSILAVRIAKYGPECFHISGAGY